MSLGGGAGLTDQNKAWEIILSSGDKFSIINFLKWDVNKHILTCKFD